MSTPYDRDDELSTIVLGTLRSPGSCKLRGYGRKKNWDIQAAKGTTGASTTLNGDPIGQFEAEFYLASDGYEDGPSDFDLWEDYQRLIESTTNGPTPVALPIYHPDLARNRWTEVVNGGIGDMLHDGRGGATVTVTFLEYRPAKPKPSAKPSAKPTQNYANTDEGGRSPPKEDPNAAAKRELAGLLDEAKKP